LLGKQKQLDRQQTDLAQKDSDLDAEREVVRLNLARSNLILAENTWKDHDALGTVKALGQIPDDLRQWEWRYQQRRALGSYATLWGHTGLVTSVVFSPDGARLASGSIDQTVVIWDMRQRSTWAVLTGPDLDILTVAWSPDGHRLYTAGADRTISTWLMRPTEAFEALCGDLAAGYPGTARPYCPAAPPTTG
jgi:WD40 repeat protein